MSRNHVETDEKITSNPRKNRSRTRAAQQESDDTIRGAFFRRLATPLRHMRGPLKRNRWARLLVKGLRSLKVFGFRGTWAKVKAYQTGKTAMNPGSAVIAQNGVTLRTFIECCKAAGGEVFGEEALLQDSNAERVLLVSHELNLTGAPIALQYFAESLQRQGKNPVMIAMHDDTLRPALTEEGIPVLTHPALYRSSVIADFAPLFSLIVLNTIVGAPIAAQLSGSDVPVLWWIHEAHVSYHPGMLAAMPKTVEQNIHVSCGGAWAQNVLRQYRPAYQADSMLYYVPDLASIPYESNFVLENAGEKTVFASVGALERRKGQDILAEAIRRIPGEEREKCFFVFVGRGYDSHILSAIRSVCEEYPENVRYISELGKDDLHALYERMDCLICSSTDDPMPLVVTEALALSKRVICSENTGSAALLREMDSGIVYRNNDAGELAGCISRVLSGANDTADIAHAARSTYEKYFSTETFDRNTADFCRHFITSQRPPLTQKVSVVIPTYNPGAEIESLLEKLIAQRGIGTLELVIVDSGSTDGTLEIARAYGAKLIEIPQEKFSHSYARNLGVEAASGELVMMMTQDAVPNGEYWLWKMAQPIVKDGVAAVSCRQIPKPDCDLFGRVNLYIHANYMGILKRDRILSLPDTQNVDSLRKNGQLDDVACMFVREIFLRFRYRGSYAEDLDLGLRLIRAGHRLALLSSVSVIHSHTRPVHYHLKRSVVDVATLQNLLPDFAIHKEDSAACMNQIITMYVFEKLFTNELLQSGTPADAAGLHSWAVGKSRRIREKMYDLTTEELKHWIENITVDTDQKFQQLVLEFLQQCGKEFRINSAGVFDLSYYVTDCILPFLAAGTDTIEEETKREIADAMEKQTAQLSGSLLAGYVINHHGEDPYLDTVCRELSKGV